MSFAASLLRTSGDIKHRFNTEIDAWVSEQVDRTFKPACQSAASKGATSVQCTSGGFAQAQAEGMSLAFAGEQGVFDAVTTCFLAKLAALGLSTCEAEHDGVYWDHGHHQYAYQWSLKASWLGAPEQEEAPQRLPSGASAECPA
eukprot:CAMPEP_0204189506 /NCGR_PEP_ID=MMETSP0361-20130328/58547_1 /ASSEMBLY_ACC=CAM_ASM_000343 /TAXON_ID=268821 /ORGANISM="Scrippsiella Hangoei, Strain SHTV-5" /LENGTH=143 /DNA_ID=CAMNT_0051150197 /DNA_START=8 /DNA_END=439 /DNA_ORIENTATION=+